MTLNPDDRRSVSVVVDRVLRSALMDELVAKRQQLQTLRDFTSDLVAWCGKSVGSTSRFEDFCDQWEQILTMLDEEKPKGTRR